MTQKLKARLDCIFYPGEIRAVVRNMELSVNSCELFGIYGPSGSGKTTLLRALYGDERVSVQGMVNIYNDVSAEWISRTEACRLGLLAFIEPVPFLLSHLSVAENVSISHKLNRAAYTRAKNFKLEIPVLLKSLGLSGMHDKKPLNLSHGQRFRVGFARALAQAPSVMLVDEVFTGLDDQTAKTVLNALTTYCEETDAAAICISHRPELLNSVATQELFVRP